MAREPTKMTFYVDSTSKFMNDVLFNTTMNDCFARFNIVRVMATDGTSVAHLARHWCKRNNVRFTLMLLDTSISFQEDRKRRIELIVGEDPHAALFFSQFENWLQFAKALHTVGVPVSMIYPTEDNTPDYVEWKPVTIWMPSVTSFGATVTKLRKKKPRKEKQTREEKNEYAREYQAKKRHLTKLRRQMVPTSVKSRGKPIDLMQRKSYKT